MKKIRSKHAISRSESGKLGAQALNSDPEKKRAAAIKAAATRKAENPHVFCEMGAKGGGSKKRANKNV